MAGLLDFVKTPEFWNWVGGVGGGLSNAGRGRGFDISGANQQLFQGMAQKQQAEKLKGLMSGFNFTPEQQALLSALPPQAQQQIYMQQAFPQSGDPKRYNVGGALVDAQGNVVYQGEQGSGGFEGTGMQAQMYNILMDQNSTPRQRAAAKHYFSQPRPQMTESGLVMVPGEVPQFPPPQGTIESGPLAPAQNTPLGYPSIDSGGNAVPMAGDPQIVPGTEKNPNKMAAEGAGRYTSARRVMERAREGDWKLLLDDDGSLDRLTLAQINNDLPLTDKAQKAYNFLWSMIDTKLRIMTGAAAPDAEVDRQVKQLLPRTISAAGVEAYKSAVDNELKFFEDFVKNQENVPSGAAAPTIKRSLSDISDEELKRSLGLY